MQRFAYRLFDDHNSWVVNHTVNVGGNQAGVRWYELRASDGGNPFIHQQGTYAPDGDSRWMGSIAQDRSGNIALGYSVSGASTFPSIRYAGRLADDPPGILQAETTLTAGSGSKTDPGGRWGDYTSMSVDPSDNCTFWYTNEYLQTTSQTGWKTRIGAFKFPGCDLSYSTYWGGGADEVAGGYNLQVPMAGMAVDGYNNVYFSGRTHSLDMYVTEEAYQPECNACGFDLNNNWLSDAFVTKLHLNPDGTAEVVYSTYLGGSGFEYATDIDVDASQNIYVTGSTSSDDFPTTANAFMPTCPSCRTDFPSWTSLHEMDFYVTKIISDGTGLAYSTYLGGNNYQDWSYGLAVDAGGYAYVIGSVSAGFPMVNPYQSCSTTGAYGGNVLAKLNTDGTGLVYSTCLNGTFDIWDVAVNGDGEAYVVGAAGDGFPVVNAFQPFPRYRNGYTPSDAFITKFNAAGDGLIFSSYLGGGRVEPVYDTYFNNRIGGWDTSEAARGVAVDAQGDAYVVGATIYSDFPVTSGSYQQTCNACGLCSDDEGNFSCHGNFHWEFQDAFVTKVYTSGALLWSTYLGGSFGDMATDVAVSPAGNVYVVGTTYSTDFPMADPVQEIGGTGGYDDLFFSVFDATGSTLLKSTYLGGANHEWGTSIALLGDQPYITGVTASTDYPVSENAIFPTNPGNWDFFFTKLGLNASLPPGAPPPTCGPGSDYVVTSGNGSIVPGTDLVPGSQREVGTVNIPLPFTVKLYENDYNTVNASANGVLQFGSNYPDHDPIACLPISMFSDSILAYWEDLDMRAGITTTFAPGIYTALEGVAPSREFHIEYRACLFGNGGCDGQANFEVTFREGEDGFDIVYGTVDPTSEGATVGVQKGAGLRSVEYICNDPTIPLSGGLLEFTHPECPSPTPTRTATIVPTRTNTGTRTPTYTRTNTGSLPGRFRRRALLDVCNVPRCPSIDRRAGASGACGAVSRAVGGRAAKWGCRRAENRAETLSQSVKVGRSKADLGRQCRRRRHALDAPAGARR
jgi:hypothetical protein